MNLHFDIGCQFPSKFSISKFDKWRALLFKYTQFIKSQSNWPVRNAYNVIISQILPILYLSNSNQFAINEIVLLVQTLV